MFQASCGSVWPDISNRKTCRDSRHGCASRRWKNWYASRSLILDAFAVGGEDGLEVGGGPVAVGHGLQHPAGIAVEGQLAAGILFGLAYPVLDPLMGVSFGWKAFVAAILGGRWSIMGACIAGFMLGFIEIMTVPAIQIIFFVVYFVLGFLLYGTLYAGIGAAFDTEQEAQNFQGAVTMFLVVPLVLMMQILNQPDGTLSVVLSLVPFFTPMLMFLRMTLTQVPVVQLAASVVIMLGTIVFAAWIVGKIYRVGILMHGSKPKLKDLMRWVKEA